MVRPIKFRRVMNEPDVNYFKPRGIPLRELKEITLTVGEFEAIRLKDFKEMDQTDAARKMNISQPTFNRLLKTARKKIAEAIATGKAIKIEGGVYRTG
jgi:predicted DNA-binding protein (UPF0251 family)